MSKNIKIRALTFLVFGIVFVFKNYVIVIGQTAAPAPAATVQPAGTGDAAQAIAVVNKLFAEMAAANPAGILAVHTPESNLVAVFKKKDGKSVVQNINGDAFSKMFADKTKVMEERMYDHETRIFGDLALVWGRYAFFSGGKLSHCGVNVFELVRTDAGWKIAGGSSTIEPGGCNETEKAMKASVK